MSKKQIMAGVASASALLATAASAADLSALVNDGVTASSSVDWTGFYAGVSASMFHGDLPVGHPGSDYTIAGGTVGGFFGFREDAGNGVVWGTELAYYSGVPGGGASLAQSMGCPTRSTRRSRPASPWETLWFMGLWVRALRPESLPGLIMSPLVRILVPVSTLR